MNSSQISIVCLRLSKKTVSVRRKAWRRRSSKRLGLRKSNWSKMMRDRHYIRERKKKSKSQQSRIKIAIIQRNLSHLNADLTILMNLLMTTNHLVYSKEQLRIICRTFKNSLSQNPIYSLYKQKKKEKKCLNHSLYLMKFGEPPYLNHQKVKMKFLCNTPQNISLSNQLSKFKLRNTLQSNKSPIAVIQIFWGNEKTTLTWIYTTK